MQRNLQNPPWCRFVALASESCLLQPSYIWQSTGTMLFILLWSNVIRKQILQKVTSAVIRGQRTKRKVDAVKIEWLSDTYSLIAILFSLGIFWAPLSNLELVLGKIIILFKGINTRYHTAAVGHTQHLGCSKQDRHYGSWWAGRSLCTCASRSRALYSIALVVIRMCTTRRSVRAVAALDMCQPLHCIKLSWLGQTQSAVRTYS